MDRSPHLFAKDWYEDITQELKSSAATMEQGSIALAPGMKLYDALPAFQIGSEKVDTGDPKHFRLLVAEIDDAEEKWPIYFNEDKCIAFLDALSGAEMAWQAGSSMVQSILSCLLMEHELALVSDDSKSVANALREIKVSKDDLAGVVRLYVWTVILTVSLSSDVANLSGIIYPEEDLHISRHWLFVDQIGAHLIMEKLEQLQKQTSGLGLTRIAQRLAMRATWITVLRQKITKKTVHLDTLNKHIEHVFTDNTAMLEPLPWFTNGCEMRLEMECLRLDTERFDCESTKRQWLKITEGIASCVHIFSIERSVDLWGVFLQFSARNVPAVVRAMLKEKIQQGQIVGLSTKQWVTKDITETAPPFLLDTKDKQIELFLIRASPCYSDMLTIFCQNRCRMREGLCMMIISFDSLHVASEQTSDAVVPYLASWVYFRKLQAMLWVVLLGFETNIISYRETGYTYWFGFRIAQFLLQHLGRMRTKFEHHGQQARDSLGHGFLLALELESQVVSQLLTAEYMLFIALHKGVSPPKPIVSTGPSEEMLYALRFQMFESIGVPTIPKLCEYKAEFEALDVETALRGAANASQSVRNLLGTLGPLAAENPEIPKLKKSAIGLSVAVSSAIRGYKPDGLDVEGYHPYFPVPKMKNEK